MILRESETRFVLTFTSGGAANAEMWLRDWIETWGLRVHVLDRTMSLAAINVTGPLARSCSRAPASPTRRASSATSTPTSPASRATSCGCRSRARRRSSSTTRSIGSVELWRALMELGADLGIRPHGLQALFGLRLEKGHVIVGMDTELDTTPRRLGMDWAVRMEKPFFIGRPSLERTAQLADHRRWIGFTMDGVAPRPRASPIWSEGEIVGNVTGSWTSPAPRQGRAARLAASGRRSPTRRDRRPRGGRHADAVLRPGGPSVLALEPMPGLRVVADPAALDRASLVGATATSPSFDSPRTRRSPSARRSVEIDDEHAIVESEAGFVGAWLDRRGVRDVGPAAIEWPLPAGPAGARPGVGRRGPGEAVAPGDRAAPCSSSRRPTPTSSQGAWSMSELRRYASSRSAGTSRSRAYDVVIIGGGGHGLATAYYLATRHGITNVAVVEADYIASGNTGRNTTIIRANYGIPEAIRFYQHCLEMYQAPRGRDRRRDPPPDQGPRLDRPHRDGACGPSAPAA